MLFVDFFHNFLNVLTLNLINLICMLAVCMLVYMLVRVRVYGQLLVLV